MPFYSEQTLHQVRSATDILDLIRPHTDLNRAGPDSYKGLCPFHREKTPSFNVSPEKGFFFCFGCKTGGDAFKFMKLMFGMSFPESVRELARRAGVSLPEGGDEPQGPHAGPERRQRLHKVMDRASEIYEARLWSDEGVRVRNYLRGRGVGDALMRSFRLGYSHSGWDGLIRELAGEGFHEDILLEAGLAKANLHGSGGAYDAFRDRLMIPIQERDGRTVAFAARLLDAAVQSPQAAREGDREAPKFINSPATPIWTKGRLLYGMPQAEPFLDAAECIFLVEGYFDLIALHAAGIKYAVAAMGTALTQTQVNMLRGKGLEVYLLFDGDEAGRLAALKAVPKLLNARLEGRAVTLPGDHDPDTFIRERGPVPLLELAEKAPEALEHALSVLLPDPGASMAAKGAAVDYIKDFMAEVAEPVTYSMVRSQFARGLGVPPEDLPAARSRREQPFPEDEGPGGPAPFAVGQPHAREDHEGGGDLEPHSMKLLEHVLMNPATAGALERVEGRWPQEQCEELASELLSQYRETGTVSFIGLSTRWREGPLGELVARVANSVPDGDTVGAKEDAEVYAGRVLQLTAKRRLQELTALLKAALEAGDEEGVARIRAEQAAAKNEAAGRTLPARRPGPGG
ncbi:MAG: DNA primase [Deltaproteobacteria bacterium]|nr:DNA primase [Deltaproteobacteria bacterium]